MTDVHPPSFGHPRLEDLLDAMSADDRDRLEFGVIGFDRDTIVRVYNRFESAASGLADDIVLGHPLVDEVAVCMNNDLVAQHFEDAEDAGSGLGEIVPDVLTLRMRPVLPHGGVCASTAWTAAGESGTLRFLQDSGPA